MAFVVSWFLHMLAVVTLSEAMRARVGGQDTAAEVAHGQDTAAHVAHGQDTVAQVAHARPGPPKDVEGLLRMIIMYGKEEAPSQTSGPGYWVTDFYMGYDKPWRLMEAQKEQKKVFEAAGLEFRETSGVMVPGGTLKPMGHAGVYAAIKGKKEDIVKSVCEYCQREGRKISQGLCHYDAEDAFLWKASGESFSQYLGGAMIREGHPLHVFLGDGSGVSNYVSLSYAASAEQKHELDTALSAQGFSVRWNDVGNVMWIKAPDGGIASLKAMFQTTEAKMMAGLCEALKKKGNSPFCL